MINGKKVLGLIPARGGSKRIPRKNIRLLGGKPLIAWTIEEANKSIYLDSIVVSTDDEEIATFARHYGADVPFMRPPELATDTARGIDVVLHALNKLSKYNVVVLLQPTSPFRKVEDIDGAIELWTETDKPVVGVSEASKSPYWMYQMDEQSQLQELFPNSVSAVNRQNLPKFYVLNGSVYVAGSQFLSKHQSFLTRETRGFLVPIDRAIDIDSESDWRYAEWTIHSCRETS